MKSIQVQELDSQKAPLTCTGGQRCEKSASNDSQEWSDASLLCKYTPYVSYIHLYAKEILPTSHHCRVCILSVVRLEATGNFLTEMTYYQIESLSFIR